jgi:TetR/AcrR family transcriptional regulator
MKRTERNLQSRQRILASAMAEFSEKGYGLSSINTICAADDLSKGILYHYFKDKDEVYLACIQACFDALTAYLQEHKPDGCDGESRLRAYFEARLGFFQENPQYHRIFCGAVISPPPHLSQRIKQARDGFDALNLELFTDILDSLRLRPGITKAQVVDIFFQFQNFIGTQHQFDQDDGAAYESACQMAVSVLLYGVIQPEEMES